VREVSGTRRGDATWYGDDDVVCSPPAAYGGPRSPLTRVREEALRRNRCAVVVDGLGAGEMEAGDTERASRAWATTRMWYRLWWWRSRQRAHEQRGVRGDATRDRQRCRRTRAGRVRYRAALGIGGCVPYVPWDAGGTSRLR
jgi:hypothetical protein